MLGSSFLDIAIGIVFVFLLLSLIATTVNEIIASLLSMRGKQLLLGLQTLLNDTPANVNGLVDKIYNHGQIFGLFVGDFDAKKPGNLPSYIPTENFVMAMLDIVPAAAAALKAPDPASGAPQTAEQMAQRAAEKAAQDLADQAAAAAKQAAQALTELTAKAPPPPPDQVAIAQETAGSAAVRAKLASLRLDAMKLANNDATKKVGVPLLAMFDSAGHDITKLRAHVEEWYKGAMDRVSGWYRYSTQRNLFFIGIVLAVALNADTVNIVQQLSKNPTLRESIVAAAQSSAAAQKKPAQTNEPAPGSTPTQGANPGPGPANSPDQPNKPAGGDTSGQGANPDLKNQLQGLSKEIKQVEELGIPLGWPAPTPIEQLKPGESSGWFHRVWQMASPVLERPTTYLGWLLTAIAVSLGAPFWFDMLNKIMVVRSTIKPGEKSEQGSQK